MSSLRLGFLGAGKMASALARGFLRGGAVTAPDRIIASCPKQDAHLLGEFSMLGCKTSTDNRDVILSSDVLLMAVKPGVVPAIATEVVDVLSRHEVEQQPFLISMAAGVKLSQLEEALQPQVQKVVRIMPNTACVVGAGATAFCSGSACTDEEVNIVTKLFSSVGECHMVQESMLDVVTALSGSGTAYMYLIIESLADGAVKQGLSRDLSYRLAAQTLVGAGRMVLETGQHPAMLKDSVTSPGGTTIAAIDILERSGIRSAMMRAIEAAAEKSRELAG